MGFLKMKKKKKRLMGGVRVRVLAYFECDVITSDADLQLLFSDDVFLWPVCVVFPLHLLDDGRERREWGGGREYLLDYLALLDDAL